MKATFSFHFNGRCEEAFRFYEQCLGGKVSFMLTWGNSPMAKDVPPEWGSKICHATLTFADVTISGGDMPPGKYETPKGVGIVLSTDDLAEAERIFNAFAKNGDVRMPLQETFWARRYGFVVDEFGITWEINCEKPM